MPLFTGNAPISRIKTVGQLTRFQYSPLDNNLSASELEPLVNNKTIHEDDKKSEIKTEYKKNFRPFSQYDYAEGKFTSRKDVANEDVPDTNQNIMDGNLNKESWYQEVVELRKKAGEYKVSSLCFHCTRFI